MVPPNQSRSLQFVHCLNSMFFTVALVATVLLLVAAALLFRKARLVTSAGPICHQCGYSIQTDSTHCPECGTTDPYDHRVLEDRSLRLQIIAAILVVMVLIVGLVLFVAIFIL